MRSEIPPVSDLIRPSLFSTAALGALGVFGVFGVFGVGLTLALIINEKNQMSDACNN